MLQLSPLITYDNLLFFFSYFYLYFSHLGSLLVFYPIGILSSLYIIFCIFYMIIKASMLLNYFFKNLLYFGVDVFKTLQYIALSLIYIGPSIYWLWGFLQNLIYHYSTYILIFYLKRFQFCLFLVFIVLAYC